MATVGVKGLNNSNDNDDKLDPDQYRTGE